MGNLWGGGLKIMEEDKEEMFYDNSPYPNRNIRQAAPTFQSAHPERNRQLRRSKRDVRIFK